MTPKRPPPMSSARQKGVSTGSAASAEDLLRARLPAGRSRENDASKDGGAEPKEGGATSGVSGSSIRFDEYQEAIIRCNDHIVVAEAFAGAGKTTTAIGFTAARPKTKFLYVCFNRANANEARMRFAPHVDCKTGHSLAWSAVGRHYGKQIVQGGWRARQFQEEMSVLNVRIAAISQSILNSFFASADKKIEQNHALDTVKQMGATDQEIMKAMDFARLAWAKMQKPGESISIPHDAYLKIWSLNNPKLPYDHIVLDEAQDTNPVMMEIIRQQKSKLLLIGDRHQSIYGFRKANNAMELFEAMGARVLKMPRTWRFGQEIADIANAILSHFKGEETKIIGAGPSKIQKPKSPRAILSRTNAGLFKEAAESGGIGIYWVGGIEGYRVDLLLDAWSLKKNRRNEIASPSLRQYTSWSQLQEDAETTGDPESKLICRFIDTYGADTPDL